MKSHQQKKNYINFSLSNNKNLINSAISVGLGGLGVSLSKMAIASQYGLKLNLETVGKKNKSIKFSNLIFSESQSRIIVTVSLKNRKKFEDSFSSNQLFLIGKVIKEKKIVFNFFNNKKFEAKIENLSNYYKRDLFKK